MHLHAAKRAALGSSLFGANSIAGKLLGSERDGVAFDFANDYVLVRDSARALNYKGSIQNAIDASLISFTRATNGGYTNSLGQYAVAGSGIWRREYSPLTLQPLGYLPEPARTNLLTYSEDLTNATWTKSDTTISANAIAAPDGATTADKILEAATSAAHNVQNAAAVTNAVTYVGSVFVKAAERGFALLAMVGTGVPTTAIQINLTTGAVSTGTGTPLNAFSVQYPGGWWRVGFSLAATSTNSASLNTYCSTDGVWANRSYAGNASNGIYMWGAQFEAGAYPTSYIPTTSASVTRNADVMTVALSKLPFSAVNSTVIAIQQAAGNIQNATSGGYVWTIDDGSGNNRTSVRIGTYPALVPVNVSGGAADWGGAAASSKADRRAKTALAMLANDWQFVVDGASVSVDTTITMPVSPTTLRVGMNEGNLAHWSAPIESLVYIPRRLSAAEMIARTA